MNILLINSNPVVSRLISLCMREEDIIFEEVESMSNVILDRYAVVFVDDNAYDEDTKRVLSNLMIRKTVLLSSSDEDITSSEVFNEVIKKPFLPSDIRSVIDTLNHTEEELEETVDAHFIFPLSTEEEKELEHEEEVSAQENSDTSKILDVNEIARIRSLLEEDDEDEKTVVPEEEYETRKREVITEHLEADGLEIVSEDEIINILSSKPEKTQKKKSKTDKKKKKEKKRSKKEKEASYTFEEALIAAIEGMKVKKIKKLLKDADIKISISFKDKK